MIEIRDFQIRDKFGNIRTYPGVTKRIAIFQDALQDYGIDVRFNLRADIRELRQDGGDLD